MDRDVSWLLPHQCRGNYQACLAVLALQAAGALAKVFCAGRLGQKSVVTNAMEALWQDVAEETADKFICCERHDLVARSTVGTIIFVVERDAVLVECNQSPIGDGNTVGVGRQISKDRLGA